MEKVSLDRIKRLLKITEGKSNHELLLYVKNLQELGVNPFPYIVLVIPCPLPEDLVNGKNFFLADLLKSVLSSSSQVGAAQEPQAKSLKEPWLAFFGSINLLWLYRIQSLPPKRKRRRRERKKGKKAGQVKATGVGLEDFVDCVNPIHLS